jgi:ABC-2 type transport system permease protein
MIDDILTVVWKERKMLFRFRGSRSRFVLNLLTPLLLAVYGPLRDGPEWVQNESSVVMALLIPAILIMITVPDSFAGERERHTLGTLLASRLPDRAILFGKLGLAVAFAWGVTLAVLLLGLVIVNVVHGEGELILFKPVIALANLTLSFLMAALCAGAGVLISLRSATVQGAAQTLVAIFFVPPMLLTAALMLFREQVTDLLGKLSGEQAFLMIAGVLAVLTSVVLAGAVARFQRARLGLD